MLKLKNLDTFKEELLMINYKFNFDSIHSCFNQFDLSKTIFWGSLESYSYIRTCLFLKKKYKSNIKLKELKNLQYLYLFDNQLKEIPNFNLPNLIYLYLYNNQLTEVPDFNLPNLVYLDLSYNKLTEVPDFNLPNLQTLFLQFNKLTMVPDFNLPKLEILTLENNKLTETEKKRLRQKYYNKLKNI